MFAVPPPTPVITPVEEAAVAIEVFALVHEPPEEAFVSVVVDPEHTTAVPPIAAGCGLTVITVLAAGQPSGSV